MRQALIVLALSALSATVASGRVQPAAQRDPPDPPPSARSRIYKLEELTWPQAAEMDRERTMFILPVGMIEEHGPHLPIGTDSLGVMYEANGVSRRVRQALPEWNIVMMPAINYGEGGANEIGGMLVHPGTYGIRHATLRAIVADVGGQVAQNGFKWIFVLNGHGAPTHNIAINEACDFVTDTFRVRMLHLTALFRADAAIQAQAKKINAKHFSPGELAALGLDVHAGVGETSAMLAVRPDLVRSDYKTLPSRAGQTLEELQSIASAPGWQGYLSSPAKATASYGRAVESWWVEGFTDLILRAVRGENLSVHPRVPDSMPDNPAINQALGKALENERAFEQKLQAWLAQKKKD